MKNIMTRNTGSNHNQEMTPFSRSGDFNRLMNYFWNYFDAPTEQNAGECEPHLQIAETKDAVTVTAELPGINEKDVDLRISSDGYLTICGEKKDINESTEKDAYFSEISYGAFKRTIPLPWDLDYENAAARYSNGVLTVTVPKSQDEKQKFKKIPIQQTNN